MVDLKSRSFRGSCKCGAIVYEVSEFPKRTIHCYCKHCRQLSGGLYISYVTVGEKQFKLVKGDTDKNTKKIEGDKGKTVTRMHCTRCASSIWRKHPHLEGELDVLEGIIDDVGCNRRGWPQEIVTIWVKDAPKWTKAPAANDSPDNEEATVFGGEEYDFEVKKREYMYAQRAAKKNRLFSRG